MGCSQWKTVKFKVRSFPARRPNRVDSTLAEGCQRAPTAEQLLRRIGQLKLDQTTTGSPDGREHPNGSTPNGRLETLLQSVIL